LGGIEGLFVNDRQQKRNGKLEAQCAVLADIVISIRPVYSAATTEQRALIETMIGAAIWYIPKPPDAWTGYVSLGALKAFHPDSGIENPKFSEEHVYPRKVAARMLLEDGALNGATMATIFSEKYGRLHYITSDENKAVQPHQRANVFELPEAAYAKAAIALVKIAPEDLRQIKKRDRSTIDRYLAKT
jgi:hypothetical protein